MVRYLPEPNHAWSSEGPTLTALGKIVHRQLRVQVLPLDKLLSSTKTFADRRVCIELGMPTRLVRAPDVKETSMHFQKVRLVA